MVEWNSSTIREALLEAECLIRNLEYDLNYEKECNTTLWRENQELKARIEQLASVVEQETAALEAVERYLDNIGVAK